MKERLPTILLVWAVAATLAAAWLFGRLQAIEDRPPVVAEAAAPAIKPVPLPLLQPKVAPQPVEPLYPQYVSTIPRVFRGRWDEMISDKCESREARFYFGAREFDNFEVKWEVTGVKLYSPTEIDLHTTLKDENANQVDEVWEFKLVDGGATLTGRKKTASFFKRCPDG